VLSCEAEVILKASIASAAVPPREAVKLMPYSRIVEHQLCSCLAEAILKASKASAVLREAVKPGCCRHCFYFKLINIKVEREYQSEKEPVYTIQLYD